tara:strand:+ start:245 stop:844 length:600 start_codon:yes stop_codon:yes gene_type:complete
MNMMKNWLPLVAMTEEQRELFFELENGEVKYLDSGYKGMGDPNWYFSSSSISRKHTNSLIPRMVLKIGNYYTYTTDSGKTYTIKHKSNTVWLDTLLNSCSIFRPATQEEIESVQPKKEGYIDKDIEWDEDGNAVIYFEKYKIDISDYPIGSVHYAHDDNCYRLSGYVYEGGKFRVRSVIFNGLGTKELNKAVKARLVIL